MSKIKYAVIGIDPKDLGNIIAILAIGEVSNGDTVAFPSIVPTVYQIGDSKGVPSVHEIPFAKYLNDEVGQARRIRSTAEPISDLANEVVGKLTLLSSQKQTVEHVTQQEMKDIIQSTEKEFEFRSLAKKE